MKINITVLGKAKVTKAQAEHFNKKLSRLDKFFSTDTEAQVKVSKDKIGERLEVTIFYKGLIFRAQKTAPDLYAALDSILDILERQIIKHKTKLEKRLREGAFIENTVDDIEEEKEFDIIRTKKFSAKPMDVDEAILQMNMLNHEFFVFRNIDNEEVNVVYRRNDGGYGLLEPMD